MRDRSRSVNRLWKLCSTSQRRWSAFLSNVLNDGMPKRSDQKSTSVDAGRKGAPAPLSWRKWPVRRRNANLWLVRETAVVDEKPFKLFVEGKER